MPSARIILYHVQCKWGLITEGSELVQGSRFKNHAYMYVIAHFTPLLPTKLHLTDGLVQFLSDKLRTSVCARSKIIKMVIF